MPVKQGDRRGPYKKRGAADGTKVSLDDALAALGPWDDAAHQHFSELVGSSPLAVVAVKQHAARRATELHRLCVDLDGRACTVEELKLRVSASAQYRKWLEMLKVAEKVQDDEEEL